MKVDPIHDHGRQGKGGRMDIEAGTSRGALYPNMMENPQLRWGFIRKIYMIIALQLLVTTAVAAAVVFVRPIPEFFLAGTPTSWIVFAVIIVAPLIVLFPMMYYRERHPVNIILLGLFTICISFAIGLACSTSSGKVILEAAVLTIAVVVALTLYTFWAARRGYDFNFLGPFLTAALLVIFIYALIQVFIPLGKVSRTIYGCLASIVFSGFIVYDTDNLIKRHTYDQYISAAISLYLDIINLFMSILTIFSATE